MSTLLERRQGKKIEKLNAKCAKLLGVLRAIRDFSDDHEDAMDMARNTLDDLESAELAG